MKKIIAILIIQYSIFNIQYSASAQSWQWLNTIGGGGQAANFDTPEEQVSSMVTDSAGNVYTCGRFRGQGNPTINGIPIPSFGGYDIFVAKFNCVGNLLWVKTAGNTDDGDDAISLVLDNFGHLYVTGEVYSSPFSSYCNFMGDTIIDDVNDMFLCKMDTSGNLLWVKWAAPNSGSFNTGSLPYKINLTSNGNPKILFNLPTPGVFWSGDTINKRGIYISEFDTAGNLLQVDTVNSNFWGLGYYSDYAIGMNNDQYISGYFNNDSCEIGGQILLKISNSGISYYDAFVAKFDSSGTLKWIEHLGQLNHAVASYSLLNVSNNLIAVSLTCAPGFILGNDTIQNISNQGVPVILLLDTAGNKIWARFSQNQYTIRPQGKMSLDVNGNILFAGQFAGAAYFGSYSVVSINGGGIYVATINTSGNWTNAISIEGLGYFDIPLCTATDIDGNILVAGGFDGPLIFNGTQITSAGGYTDGFIAKYGLQCSVGIQEQTANTQGQLLLFPNPATTNINIQTSGFNNSTITIINTMGQTVFSQALQSNQNAVSINISNLSGGVYFIKVNDEKNSTTQKFIKQ